MANSPQARKRVRQTLTETERNKAQKSKMRTLIRNFREAAESGADNTEELYKAATREIDRTKSKGLIHENKANREKAKLSDLLK